MVRGRSLPRAALLESGAGTGWVPANIAINAFGDLADPNPFNSLGDLRLIPDLDTEIVMPPFNGGAPLHLFLGNQTHIDGTPWDCDPRHHAQIAIQQLKDDFGIEVIASFEHEFTLISPHQTNGNPFGLDSLRMAEPFGTDLLTTLESVGLEPENWLPEFGSGQFEITLKPAPALQAADRAILLREIVRDCARRHGLKASFVPLISPTTVGNGVHVHLSLHVDGNPITYDSTQDGNLSIKARSAFNGILKHAEALLAFTAPSQVSFLRLTPHRWSTGSICIAEQNREALLRLCPIVTVGNSNPEKSFNVEFRAADATANPWLVISVLLRALSSGLRSPDEPITIVRGDLEQSQIARALPTSLTDALKAFGADVEVRSWFSDDLIASYLGIRTAEMKRMEGLTDEEKCARYADVY